MKIGFIGCGNMASAMISGMLKKGLYKKDEIIVSNLTEEGSKRSREKLGVVTTLDNHEVVKNTKLVFLAVKPQFYEEVLNEVKDELTPEHTVVGIAPGKTLAWLEEECGQPLKVSSTQTEICYQSMVIFSPRSPFTAPSIAASSCAMSHLFLAVSRLPSPVLAVSNVRSVLVPAGSTTTHWKPPSCTLHGA